MQYNMKEGSMKGLGLTFWFNQGLYKANDGERRLAGEAFVSTQRSFQTLQTLELIVKE